MPITYNKILEYYDTNLARTQNHTFIIRSTKDETYAPLLYWVDNQKNLSGESNEIYDKYFYWADEHGFEIAKKHKFTTILKDKHYFLQYAIKDNKPIKKYTRLDNCPTCNQLLIHSS